MNSDSVDIKWNGITFHCNLSTLERDTGLSRKDHSPEYLLIRHSSIMFERELKKHGLKLGT